MAKDGKGNKGDGDLTPLNSAHVELVNDLRLTPKEQALMDVLLNPEHRMSNVTRICQVAGISRESYYLMTRRPHFQEIYKDEAKAMVANMRGQLINMGIREARKGGAAGFQYWRELMKMGGMIEDDKIKVDVDVDIEIGFAKPDELM